jgi:hypothetical protein
VSVWSLAVGAVVLAAVVLLAVVLVGGHRQRKGAFEVIDRKAAGLPTNAIARAHMATWKLAAIEEGASTEQAEAIASHLMRKWQKVAIGTAEPGEGPEDEARALARLLQHEEEALEGEHEPGRGGDGRQGQ